MSWPVHIMDEKEIRAQGWLQWIRRIDLSAWNFQTGDCTRISSAEDERRTRRRVAFLGAV